MLEVSRILVRVSSLRRGRPLSRATGSRRKREGWAVVAAHQKSVRREASHEYQASNRFFGDWIHHNSLLAAVAGRGSRGRYAEGEGSYGLVEIESGKTR